MDRVGGWLILEDLQLADPTALATLQQHLHYLHKTRGAPNGEGSRRTPSIVRTADGVDEVEGRGDSKLCVWMTVVPSEASHLPVSMLQESFICSWDALSPELLEPESETQQDATEPEYKGKFRFR